MICICSSDHLIIRLGMRKIDSLRAFDYPPWDEENVNLDEANGNATRLPFCLIETNDKNISFAM